MATIVPIQAPLDDILYEVVDGQVVELITGAYDLWVASLLHGMLQAFVGENRLGRAVSEMLFDLTASFGHQHRPDVAFVSYERWPRNRQVPSTEAWDVAPNLAVEIVSPSNPANEVVDKVAEYFLAGVELVWVVFPTQQQVYVYQSPTKVSVLTVADRLSGDAVLPELEVSLAELFETTEPAA